MKSANFCKGIFQRHQTVQHVESCFQFSCIQLVDHGDHQINDGLAQATVVPTEPLNDSAKLLTTKIQNIFTKKKRKNKDKPLRQFRQSQPILKTCCAWRPCKQTFPFHSVPFNNMIMVQTQAKMQRKTNKPLIWDETTRSL